VKPLLFVLVFLAACDKKDAPVPETKPSSNPVASIAPSASAEPVKTSVWFEGKWRGTYDAKQYAIETPEKNTGQREWKTDDGGAHVGDGKLDLVIAPSGSITGTAKGALGDHNVTGEVDEMKFRLSFVPVEPGDRAFTGSAVLDRKGEKVTGRLSASTGDSKLVRDAAVVLEKAAGG
jgi:hypothetical protein